MSHKKGVVFFLHLLGIDTNGAYIWKKLLIPNKISLKNVYSIELGHRNKPSHSKYEFDCIFILNDTNIDNFIIKFN